MKQIIYKYLEGKATEAEQHKLLKWLRNKENRFVFNSNSLGWKESLDSNQLPDENLESWNQIQAVILEKSYKQWQHSRKVQSFFKYAAIFFFMVTLTGLTLYFVYSKPIQPLYTSVVAEKGQISKVELPDGSLVWLNSGSEITYSNLFAEKNRNIQLNGEAYFNVAHNEQLPLVVSCGELNVKVLGTKFNVSAYEENKHVDVVLEKGSVELLDYCLKPGERAMFSKTERNMTVSNVNTAKFTSWKEGIINIYDQSLEQVVKRLESRYNQKFIFSNDIKDYRYTFTIKNEPLDEIINLMEKITPVKAIQKDDVIVFQMDIDKMRKSMEKS
jgi:ferric-dicitrate binding protein FerR (iron transport regulator)